MSFNKEETKRKDVKIGEGSSIKAKKVIIGDNVIIGENVKIHCHDALDKKQELLKMMESQSKKMYFDPATIDGFHVDFKCMKRKLKKVEKFRIVDLYHL